MSTLAARKSPSLVDKPPTKPQQSVYWLPTVFFTAILPLLLSWIGNGTFSACQNVWVPLPFFGYFRWDVALISFSGAELPLLWLCLRGNRLAWFLAVALIGLPLWPGQPVRYTRPPHLFLDLLHESGVSPFGKTIQIVDSGLTNEDAQRFVDLAWKHRSNWTHASSSQALGYMQFGKSQNIDRKSTKKPAIYSIELGFNPQRRQLSRESRYRLHFPEKLEFVQSIIRTEMLPTLRGVYARALNTTDIVFGEDLSPGLGLPSIAIVAPNAIWSWIVNVHTDRNYQTRIQKSAAATNCTNDPQVHAFIMPLTTPEGAGLRYWSDKDRYQDIFYEMGKMYSFDAATVHAVRPLPYYEWRRGEMRMILQAFSIQCDDGRWVLYH